MSAHSTPHSHSVEGSLGQSLAERTPPRKHGLKRKGNRPPSKSMGFYRSSDQRKLSVSSFSESSEQRIRRRGKRKDKRFGLSSGMSEEMGSIDERGALMRTSPSTSDTEEFVGNEEDGDAQGPLGNKNSISTPPPARSRSISLNTSMSVLDGTERALSVDSSLGASIQNVEKQLFDTLRKLSSQQLVKGDKGSYAALEMKDRQSVDEEEGPEGNELCHIEGE